ncbi:hypothetical protein BCR44DRAFT_249309 [Catenaria anguillulae PL171]|uniref:Uncharacterized protein n=1 Tax=Catenaria anguillulae PL171 TaxID=765915 RepID=A0A1Y2HRK7_9FUNG|nr:hypothetical protein BCR44DRAFT_249309 [Catenaria anguillulae PL171]
MWVCYHHNFKAVDEEWAQLKNLLDVGAMDPHLLHTQATGKVIGFAFNLPCLHKGNKHHHPDARHGRCHGPKLLEHVLTRYFDEAWADAKAVISTSPSSVPANKYPIMHTTLMAAIRHTAPLLRGFRSNVAYLGPAHWIKDEQEKRMTALVKELVDVTATLPSQSTSGPLPWMTASPAPTDRTSHAHVQRDLLLAQFEAMLLLSPNWKWLAVMFRSALRQVPTAQSARANFISQVLLGPTFMSPWVRGAPAQHVLLLTILRSLIFHLQSPASPALAANDVQAIVSTIADTIPDPIPYNVKQGGFAPRGDPLSAWNRERRDAPYEYRPATPADRLLSPATVWVVRSLERLLGAYRARVTESEFEALLEAVGEDRIGRLLDMGVDAEVFEVNVMNGE